MSWPITRQRTSRPATRWRITTAPRSSENDRWTGLKYAAADLLGSGDRPKADIAWRTRTDRELLGFSGCRRVTHLIELFGRRDFDTFARGVESMVWRKAIAG